MITTTLARQSPEVKGTRMSVGVLDAGHRKTDRAAKDKFGNKLRAPAQTQDFLVKNALGSTEQADSE